MDYVSNQKPQIEAMLAAIGISDIDELFKAIPSSIKLPRPSLDDGLSEYEGIRLIEKLASNNTFPSFDNYLGAGSYEHHVPALVAAICSKSEFLTSYTPYQPEASQGMLQIIFEFQTAICALTGMDVANASVYDGASACAEAALMALRANPDRSKILISPNLHPHYRGVINQYLSHQEASLESLDIGKIDQDTAAILIQYPNFFGVIEEMEPYISAAKKEGALTILCANPIVYGLFASAGELGADIAVGDCQPFGIPMQFGGPYVGYMACKENLVRQLPGRIAGQTVDTKGRRGFVLTLQTREQHIRREKATSNICTNQALAALASLISILWYGKEGVKELALTNYQRAHYLKDRLKNIPGISFLNAQPTFNEFVINFEKPLPQVIAHFRKHQIEPGLQLEQGLLVAVTETKSLEQLDRYVSVASSMA